MEASTLPEPALAEHVARCLGQRLTGWRLVTGGYTAATRLLVTCEDGTSVFVKRATDALTAAWLRTEYGVYSQVQAAFLPRLLAWEDDGGFPLLVLEDLSAALWQVPWTMARVTQVLTTLQQVAATPPPASLERLEAQWSELAGWVRVAQEPAPFLRLGLCSATWLTKALDMLVTAETRAPLAGEALVHMDVRSDNLCFVEDRVVLVDWNCACRGNGTVDIAAWLPRLHMEGGPLPETILPHAPHLAALISGCFAARAGLPAVNVQARVRTLQLAQLRVALPWAVRALGLPALDGEARTGRV